jgi:hypothetical protein
MVKCLTNCSAGEFRPAKASESIVGNVALATDFIGTIRYDVLVNDFDSIKMQEASLHKLVKSKRFLY